MGPGRDSRLIPRSAGESDGAGAGLGRLPFTRPEGRRDTRRMRPPVQIRPFEPADRDQVLELSARLGIGVAAWRDPRRVLAAVRHWIESSLDSAGTDGKAVFVATGFYRHLGYEEEDIRLTRRITP